jgi:hypothetical protein
MGGIELANDYLLIQTNKLEKHPAFIVDSKFAQSEKGDYPEQEVTSFSWLFLALMRCAPDVIVVAL